eukprot:864285-Prymnesium_polylepis.1
MLPIPPRDSELQYSPTRPPASLPLTTWIWSRRVAAQIDQHPPARAAATCRSTTWSIPSGHRSCLAASSTLSLIHISEPTRRS